MYLLESLFSERLVYQPLQGGVENMKSGMVTAAHPLAARAGVEVLKAGGNAVDAAVATGFSLGVVEPYMCGLGGGGVMLVHLTNGESAVIWFCTKAPVKATPNMFEIAEKEVDIKMRERFGSAAHWSSVKNNANIFGHKAVAVPGTVAGFTTALEKFGTIELNTALESAIKYAEEGFFADPSMSLRILSELNTIKKYPNLSSIFLKDGLPPGANIVGFGPLTKIIQVDLADTLRKIARFGFEGFYKGEVAEAIIRDMEKNGGIIIDEDLSRYRPLLMKPSTTLYHEYEVLQPPGSVNIEVFNILENFDLKNLGHNSPEYIHLIAEAIKLAFMDIENTACGDFNLMPLSRLYSKDYAKELVSKIKSNSYASKIGLSTNIVPDETTSFSVIDKERNMVACTFTLGSLFGSKVLVPKTGVILNNNMKTFNPVPGTSMSIEPGRFRYWNGSPLLIKRNEKSFMSIGSPGFPVASLLQVFFNVIHFGMSIQQAIDAPRIGRETANTKYAEEITLDSRIPRSVAKKLKKMGHKLIITEPQGMKGGPFGRPNGIVIKDDGTLDGGRFIIDFQYGAIAVTDD